VVGYVFYHSQDTERAAAGGGLFLRFDSVEDDREKKTTVGRLIADTMEQVGLRSDWNSDPETAIHVRLEWRKRRHDD
jgi:hypothetical protein